MPSNEEDTPLSLLLRNVERDLHVRRRDILGKVSTIEQALFAYRRALEEESAREYARGHGLKTPEGAGVSSRTAARNLLSAVQRLPEVDSDEASGADTGGADTGGAENASSSDSRAAGQPSTQPDFSGAGVADSEDTFDAPVSPSVRPIDQALPRIVDACDDKRLVIVGALSGRKRTLPEPLDRATEWIDTGDGGAHAIGNLPTRIRQGRIFGVIICDQAISHKHSDPLIAAARGARVPVGFAGKGGGAAIGRALKAIEEQLEQRS